MKALYSLEMLLGHKSDFDTMISAYTIAIIPLSPCQIYEFW